MLSPAAIVFEFFLVPLAVVVIYHDVRYRRIPNPFVLATLISGVAMNLAMGGWRGALSSLGGCVLAFL
jgi:Flp pilus assembly protein protease CpaA